jgi:hypothetical protein
MFAIPSLQRLWSITLLLVLLAQDTFLLTKSRPLCWPTYGAISLSQDKDGLALREELR